MGYGNNYYSKVGLSSFDEVAKRYAETTPIRGARASQDLRPLGKRAYWWNRIEKVSDTKYLLCDGHWAYVHAGVNSFVTEQTAPIVWERRDDGDYMTVRSHMNNGMSVSRYTFLHKWLPKDMGFDWYSTSGKHFVKYKDQDFYLPKFEGRMDWQNKTFEMTADHKLVFKCTPDGFERVGDLVPMQTRRVDKMADQHYKPKMKELWDWMCVVLPVMGDTLGDAKQQYASDLTNGSASYWYWDKYVDKKLVLEILDNPEHEQRMALAGILAYKVDAIRDGRFSPKADSYARLRSTLRRVGGLYAIELK
jgi:hypothetical protein